MEFAILGPLTIRDAGAPCPVAAAKQRVVLAVLLLRAGHVVPTDTLAQALWGEHPPATALPSLRNYVMRLRRRLGGAGERIHGRDGGYLIEVGSEELDLARFTRWYRQGATELNRGAFADASAALGQALGQWRGPALADVDSDAVQRDECPRLAADRLDALELKLDADRRLGRYDTPLGELRAFALAHPERESLWEHLILALLQHGRRSEADAAFRQIRQVLREDFGVAPGTRLSQLHRRLAGPARALLPPGASASAAIGIPEPGSALLREPPASAPTAAATVEATPLQVPADLADFTGRVDDTAAACALLTAACPRAARVLVFTGPPGIGKSALAVHVAHAVRPSYPDGILYADLRSAGGEPLDPEAALESFLETLAPERRSGAEGRDGRDGRSALLRSALADRRVLLVLDGAAESAQVRPLLPSAPHSAVLITSRLRLDDLAGSRHLELGPFSAAESTQLIGRIAGRARVAAEPQAVSDLMLACGNLPLAVRIAASRLAARPSWSVRNLVERLADRGRRLDELRTGQLDVRASLGGPFRTLPSSAAAALPRLATLDRPALSVGDAAALLRVPPARAEQVLECLVDHRFLVTTRPGSYRLPDLIRAFALEQAS